MLNNHRCGSKKSFGRDKGLMLGGSTTFRNSGLLIIVFFSASTWQELSYVK